MVLEETHLFCVLFLFDGCSEGRKGQFPQKSDNKMKISFVERKEPREQGREPREELTGELL